MIKNDSADGPPELFDLDAVMQATSLFGLSYQIRERRSALGWSRRELSERSGISQHTIGRLESGEECNPTHQTVKQIAEAMKLFVILEIVPADVLLARAETYKKGGSI
jgi:transcriptional regulator with XRE-family HTH domain